MAAESSDDQRSTIRSVDDGAAGARRRTLVVICGDDVGVRPLPQEGDVTVGRATWCSARIDHPSLSRTHLVIGIHGARLTVTDCGSANGTTLRGARLPPERPVEIAANETFVAGEVALVVQELRESPVRPAPAPVAPVAIAAPPAVPSGPVSPQTRIVLDPAMKRLHELTGRIARGTIGVLITGETGVGKEALAELVHQQSPRAAGPLVRVNCAALSDTLIDAELFGHERGAFTGAQRERRGLIEAAHGGTLLLDEVGELSPSVQAKLLRVLEDGQVLRLGATTPRAVDVRFVAATNRDLEAESAVGRFRRDLYFRLAGVVLAIPPLRERPREIEALARAFASETVAGLGRPGPRLGDDVIAILEAHAWPGNVRELRHVIERAVLLAEGPVLEPAHLPAALVAAAGAKPRAAPASASASPAAPDLDDEIAALERRRIVEALAQSNGNQTRAAALLGMPRRTLIKRIERYGLPRPQKR